MNESRFLQLLEQFKQGSLTPAEVEEFHLLVNEGSYDSLLGQDMLAMLESKPSSSLWTEEKQEALLININRKRSAKRTRVFMMRFAVAAIFMLAVAGVYLFLMKQPQSSAIASYKNDVAPGKTGAKLRLSDGRMIMIDTVKDGLVAVDGKVKILKQNGRIVYEGATDLTAYNEIVADKGRQISAELPDGSVVYLNAASTLRYPLHFSGKERLVEMTGEAYFEVTHNAAKPFKVKAGNEIIEDLGTKFNINAYTDEAAMKTTLLEGSVKVRNTVLQPSEQASIDKEGVLTLVKDADLEDVMAWKNGEFRYHSVDFETIMRQAARWYDVEIVYEGKIKGTVTGGIGRDVNASELLQIMESTGKVSFEIDGKKIIVRPK
jgi:ferric-dicitrate binding protein FerR (iron transport regulator)